MRQWEQRVTRKGPRSAMGPVAEERPTLCNVVAAQDTRLGGLIIILCHELNIHREVIHSSATLPRLCGAPAKSLAWTPRSYRLVSASIARTTGPLAACPNTFTPPPSLSTTPHSFCNSGNFAPLSQLYHQTLPPKTNT